MVDFVNPQTFMVEELKLISNQAKFVEGISISMHRIEPVIVLVASESWLAFEFVKSLVTLESRVFLSEKVI